MACSIAIVRALVRYVEESPENRQNFEDALNAAIEAQLNGEDKVLSASSDGASFTRMTGGMTLEDQIACYDYVLDIIDNNNGVVPSSKTYARIY